MQDGNSTSCTKEDATPDKPNANATRQVHPDKLVYRCDNNNVQERIPNRGKLPFDDCMKEPCYDHGKPTTASITCKETLLPHANYHRKTTIIAYKEIPVLTTDSYISDTNNPILAINDAAHSDIIADDHEQPSVDNNKKKSSQHPFQRCGTTMLEGMLAIGAYNLKEPLSGRGAMATASSTEPIFNLFGSNSDNNLLLFGANTMKIGEPTFPLTTNDKIAILLSSHKPPSTFFWPLFHADMWEIGEQPPQNQGSKQLSSLTVNH
ncbi:hypothetical protein SEMRO_134_G063520.1 [Seminavis robusta]|uniref:Uncharacterized protein n=1 Tax=Seminavis robusta TaxID=568900 RepID=A0A9N8DG46_9STRA|nr:hypothetical protein SEMRO_134_G063520.1 [Seminavis robusta]|eukprot:Sro134_g063520.1 n/a (264) ;mRNA; r:75468-76371